MKIWRIRRGIGLLELMLSLAIIAILLIMATRYYQSASNNQAVSQAVDMVNAVRSGVKNSMTSHSGSSTLPDMASLVTDGYLPSSYTNSTTLNPWGGPICVSAATGSSCPGSSMTITSTSLFFVIMTGIPSAICKQITDRLNNTLNAGESISSACALTSPTGFAVSYLL